MFKKKKPPSPGIYQIVCMKNGMIYVGKSNRPAKRIKEHYMQLRHGSRYNKKLQLDFYEYGDDSFACEIVEEVPRETDCGRAMSRKEHNRKIDKCESEWMLHYVLEGMHPLYNRHIPLGEHDSVIEKEGLFDYDSTSGTTPIEDAMKLKYPFDPNLMGNKINENWSAE